MLLAIASSCEVFNCLPEAGGLFDQDPYVIEGIKQVLMGRAKHEERKASKDASRG